MVAFASEVSSGHARSATYSNDYVVPDSTNESTNTFPVTISKTTGSTDASTNKRIVFGSTSFSGTKGNDECLSSTLTSTTCVFDLFGGGGSVLMILCRM